MQTIQLLILITILVFVYQIATDMRLIRRKLRQLLKLVLDLSVTTPVVAETIVVATMIDGKEVPLEGIMNLKVTQKYPLIVKGGKDKKGNAAPIDASGVQFSTDDVNLAKIEVGEDGVPYLIPVSAVPGDLGKLMGLGDGDAGDGVKPLNFEAAINWIAGDAEVLDIEVGAGVDL